MVFETINLVLSILTFLTLVIYAYFTYLIAKDVYEPFVSFTFNQPSSYSHLNFILTNKSKIEVEVFGKLIANINGEVFDFKNGFYGDGHPWILQPFTEGRGHFELRELTNQKDVKLGDLIKKNIPSSLKFTFQIKYRKVGSRNWKKSLPQKFAYDFSQELFWLNV